MTVRYVKTGGWAVALVLSGLLAACSSTANGDSTGAAPSSTVPVSRTTAPAGAEVHWRLDAVPETPRKECGAPDQCVLLGTERGALEGDLTGTSLTGSSTAFSKAGKFFVARTDLFRGTVTGCGSGTLVLAVNELADLHGGSGDWRIVEGFGTGDLAHATGHGTGRGTVAKDGFHSQWEGVIDCGR
jgi:hypothetical protein